MIIQAQTENIDIQLVTQTSTPGVTIIPETLSEVRIQGAIVDITGKTDLTAFQTGDKFRYWHNERYVHGIIIDATSITLPTDLNDETKIKIILDF